MADKVYIPNLVVNEISDGLIDDVADKISEKGIFANLNKDNIFTKSNTFNSSTNLNGEVGVSGTLRVYSDIIEIGKATTGGLEIQTSDDNVTMNLVDTGTLTINNKLKSELQRELNIDSSGGSGSVDTSNLAKLDSNNTFTSASNQTFNGNVAINGILNAGNTNFYGNNTFYSNNTIKATLIVANNNANQELAITPVANGVSINLGDNCTLTMNAKMISELKRLLGIQ